MYANKMRTALLEPPSHWLPISMYDMQRINYRAWSSAPINILNLDFGLKSVRSAYHKLDERLLNKQDHKMSMEFSKLVATLSQGGKC